MTCVNNLEHVFTLEDRSGAKWKGILIVIAELCHSFSSRLKELKLRPETSQGFSYLGAAEGRELRDTSRILAYALSITSSYFFY